MALRKFYSLINGTLEINTDRGRKILDGARVNLSYGSVHRIWSSGLRRVNLSDVNHVLLLGLGGGSVIDILRNKYGFTAKITAVELDPVMIKVAREEFGIRNAVNQKIVKGDAFQYIKSTRQKFDLIITDVFIESKVAEQVFADDYWQDIERILTPGGFVLVNVSTSGRQIRKCKSIIRLQGDFFDFRLIEKAGGSNTLLLGVKKKQLNRRR